VKNREVSGLQGASQNVGLTKIHEVLFIDKINALPIAWVRSSAGMHALNRTCMCLIARNRSRAPMAQAS
jgi:hypothetical protein